MPKRIVPQIVAIGVLAIILFIVWQSSSDEKITGQMVVIFDDVSGLQKGHKALVSGMEVGQVSDLTLRKDGKVKVTINLYQSFQIYKGYKVAVQNASALGGKHINIDVGSPQKGGVSLKQSHKGKTMPSILEEPNIRETFSSLKKVGEIIQEKVSTEEGTLGLLFTRDELYNNIQEIEENVRTIGTNSEGFLGKVFSDEKSEEDIEKALEDLQEIEKEINSIAEEIANGNGSITKFMQDEQFQDEATQVFADLRTIIDNIDLIMQKIQQGKGSIGRWANDLEMAQEIDGFSNDIKKLQKKFELLADHFDKSALGIVFSDAQFRADIKEIRESFEVVSTRFKQGKGTIAKLMNDEILFKEMERVLGGFASFLDVNENDPMGSITNIGIKGARNQPIIGGE